MKSRTATITKRIECIIASGTEWDTLSTIWYASQAIESQRAQLTRFSSSTPQTIARTRIRRTQANS
jgi:hypothetical protein